MFLNSEFKTSLKKNLQLSNLIPQVLLILFFIFVVYFFANNAQINMKARNMSSGFDFLNTNSGFDIQFSLIDYDGSSSYGRAYLVGLLNTLLVAFFGIFFATILGFIIGVSRLSSNWIINRLSLIYVELFRNLPGVKIEYPKLVKNFGIFNYLGGVKLIPEFLALVFSLSLYTSAFIAENVRAGILAVSKGQKEASKSLGFNNSQSLNLIVIPQALRVIIPPTTNQYLNLTKNSSLAAAIGYPDLTGAFAGTALSQTGKAIEIIFIVMMTYLTISLLISLILNWYNKKIALVER